MFGEPLVSHFPSSALLHSFFSPFFGQQRIGLRCVVRRYINSFFSGRGQQLFWGVMGIKKYTKHHYLQDCHRIVSRPRGFFPDGGARSFLPPLADHSLLARPSLLLPFSASDTKIISVCFHRRFHVRCFQKIKKTSRLARGVCVGWGGGGHVGGEM